MIMGKIVLYYPTLLVERRHPSTQREADSKDSPKTEDHFERARKHKGQHTMARRQKLAHGSEVPRLFEPS